MCATVIGDSALSGPQWAFARHYRALPVQSPDWLPGSIFMYRRDRLRTHRWLVDRDGSVLDSASFSTTPLEPGPVEPGPGELLPVP